METSNQLISDLLVLITQLSKDGKISSSHRIKLKEFILNQDKQLIAIYKEYMDTKDIQIFIRSIETLAEINDTTTTSSSTNSSPDDTIKQTQLKAEMSPIGNALLDNKKKFKHDVKDVLLSKEAKIQKCDLGGSPSMEKSTTIQLLKPIMK